VAETPATARKINNLEHIHCVRDADAADEPVDGKMSSSSDTKWAHPEITSKDYTIRGNCFYIIKTTSPCGYCSRLTDLIGFVVPYDHLQLEEDDAGRTYWCPPYIEEEQLLTGVSKLNGSALAAADAISRHCKRCIKTTIKDGREYTGPYVSHCAHCGKAFPKCEGISAILCSRQRSKRQRKCTATISSKNLWQTPTTPIGCGKVVFWTS
jgi:hypothetical protein